MDLGVMAMNMYTTLLRAPETDKHLHTSRLRDFLYLPGSCLLSKSEGSVLCVALTHITKSRKSITFFCRGNAYHITILLLGYILNISFFFLTTLLYFCIWAKTEKMYYYNIISFGYHRFFKYLNDHEKKRKLS